MFVSFALFSQETVSPFRRAETILSGKAKMTRRWIISLFAVKGHISTVCIEQLLVNHIVACLHHCIPNYCVCRWMMYHKRKRRSLESYDDVFMTVVAVAVTTVVILLLLILLLRLLSTLKWCLLNWLFVINQIAEMY